MRLQHKGMKLAVGIFGGVILLAVFLRLSVCQPYIIPSPSMEPTLKPGDRILVNKMAYHFGAPARGNIVVFHYPKDPKRTFIKRVIGLEGEKVELKNNKVYINGQAINEPYLKEGDYPPFGPQTIPQGKVLVLGDNRRQSGDSRDWGLLPLNDLIGKAWLIYYPLNRLKSI